MTNIYWISGSGPCWKILLIMEHFKIPYKSCRIDNSKKEQKSEEYLKINPRGQVPLWEDDGIVIAQSNAILHFIDKKYLDQQLFGKDINDNATTIMFCENLAEFTEAALQKFIRPVFRNKVQENSENMNSIIQRCYEELLIIEKQCKEGEWLNGAQINISDFSFLPIWERFIRAVKKLGLSEFNISMEQIITLLPKLNKWHERIVQIEGFNQAYPPHWKE